ncbi:hypothetical protein ACLX1H_006521 [Fusarium chlamydosporum]
MPPLRPLLPASEANRRDMRRKPLVNLPPRITAVSVACEACRRRKTKCDGSRPSCGGCKRKGKVCQYKSHQDRIREQESTYAELFELLRVMNEQDAADVLRRIRAGVTAGAILAQVKNGHLLTQLSLAVETRRRYEFPYVSEMPIHLSMLATRHSSLIDDCQTNTNSQHGSSHRGPQHSTTNHAHYPTPYLVPYHAAQMVEPILDKLEAKPWTGVISDNRLLRKLISSYFYYPHPCGPFTQKDLFLEDMAAGRTDFCSPLLVNAILSSASQSCLQIPNRSKIWLPESLTYRFMAEARRLWDLESLRPSSIPTIQAALILSYTTTNNGMDEVGLMYAKRACEMGNELGLFGPDRNGKRTKLGNARVFTAWAIFSWQANFDFAFFRPPYFEGPPEMSLPVAIIEPLWYGEVWVQYPHDPTLRQLYIGCKLQAEAGLHTIKNELGAVLYRGSPDTSMTLDQIIQFKQKLDDWENSLPEPLQIRNLVFPLHLTLHVTYQQLIVDFMQVIISSEWVNHPEISTLYAGKAPAMVMKEAKIMLETVVRLYYARHNFEFYDPWMAFALTSIGNMIVADLAKEENNDRRITSGYRSSLILAAQGLNKQGLNYHVSRLLTIQLQKVMEPNDLQLVQTHVTAECIGDDEQNLIEEHSYSLWPVPGVARLNQVPDKARLGNLIAGVDSLDI